LLASDLEILPAYVLGGQDAHERSDEFRPEALEHVWWHGSSEHSGAGKLHVSFGNVDTAKLTGTMTFVLMLYFVPSRAKVRVKPINPTTSQRNSSKRTHS
jgi:hypothetical protein